MTTEMADADAEERPKNAKPRDTRAGFAIYREAGGDLSRTDLNAQLRRAGYGPISKRTFKHYGNLIAAGYDRYVSINRFDISRAADPYEGASASALYTYRSTTLGVSVVLAKRDRLVEAVGQAVEVSDAGTLIHFEDENTVRGLRDLRPQPGNPATVRYLEADKTFTGRLVDVDTTSAPALLEIEFARLVSISDLRTGATLPSIDVAYTMVALDTGDQTLDLVNRRLYGFFEVVESLRALTNAAGAVAPDQVYAGPPLLRRLSVASPAVVTIHLAELIANLVPVGLIGGLLTAAFKLPAARREWHNGTTEKYKGQLALLDVKERSIQAEIHQAEAELRIAFLRGIREQVSGSNLTDADATKIIDEHVLGAVRSLGQSGVVELRSQSGQTQSE